MSREYPFSSDPPSTLQPSTTSSTEHAQDSMTLYEKEQALIRWEQDLKDRERNLESNQQHQQNDSNVYGGTGTAATAIGMGGIMNNYHRDLPKANFPSFLPVTRFAVADDIPVANQRIARFSAVVMGWTSLSLIWNFCVSIGALTIGGASRQNW
eukprot:gene11530-13455_t